MVAKPPFLPTFGNKPYKIIGRDAVLEGFLKGLESVPGHPDRAMLIIGQRGMGKTALLLEFAELAERRGFIVASAVDNDQMLDDILQGVQRKGTPFIPERKPLVQGFTAGALGFSIGLTFNEVTDKTFGFRIKLSMLCEELEKHGKGVLVLVDEVQPDTMRMRELATSYQHLVGEGRNIVIAMAGLSHSISSVLNDKILTFLNRARKTRLDMLSDTSVRLHFAKTFKSLNKEIDQEALDDAVAATRGYPYLLQLVGYYILEYLGDDDNITRAIVANAAEVSRQDMADNVYKAVLNPLSAADIRFLEAMAQDDGPSRISDIQERIGESQAYTQVYRRRLLESGVVASEQRGELNLTVPFMAEYLRTRP
ncbi:MAG: ATP-binding protein [Coriobacteriales bacterium]|jgi:hypothetical protein|nr:ATP-binding protein [Coriobacteriales bacterium]